MNSKLAGFGLVMLLILFISGSAKAKKIEYNLDETYSISKDGTLTLMTDDADVVIIGEDRDDVHMVVNYLYSVKGLSIINEHEPLEFDVIEDGKNLSIREYGGSRNVIMFAAYSNTYYDIELRVPRGIGLKLRGDDDNYDVSHVNGDITVIFEDGEASFKNCGGDAFEFEMDDGYVEISDAKGMLDVSLEDGDFIAEDCDFSSIDGYSDDGSIEVETKLAKEGVYRMRTNDGILRFHVLSGGGEFSTYYDDGGVRASSEFDLIDEDEGEELYRLPGGNASVRLKAEDGSIRLYAK